MHLVLSTVIKISIWRLPHKTQIIEQESWG